jgi:hypothetical protein
MIDVKSIRQSVHIVNDEQGQPVVQIPLDILESLLAQIQGDKPQHEKIKALLEEWDDNPDDTPDEWWDELEQFLKANRLHFPERDLHLDDE